MVGAVRFITENRSQERTPTDHQVPGVLFHCDQETEKECLRRNIFGLPQSGQKIVQKVKDGALLFLFNNSTKDIFGVFQADGGGQELIDSSIWNPFELPSWIHPYPWQVTVKNLGGSILRLPQMLYDQYLRREQTQLYPTQLSADNVVALVALCAYSAACGGFQASREIFPADSWFIQHLSSLAKDNRFQNTLSQLSRNKHLTGDAKTILWTRFAAAAREYSPQCQARQSCFGKPVHTRGDALSDHFGMESSSQQPSNVDMGYSDHHDPRLGDESDTDALKCWRHAGICAPQRKSRPVGDQRACWTDSVGKARTLHHLARRLDNKETPALQGSCEEVGLLSQSLYDAEHGWGSHDQAASQQMDAVGHTYGELCAQDELLAQPVQLRCSSRHTRHMRLPQERHAVRHTSQTRSALKKQVAGLELEVRELKRAFRHMKQKELQPSSPAKHVQERSCRGGKLTDNPLAPWPGAKFRALSNRKKLQYGCKGCKGTALDNRGQRRKVVQGFTSDEQMQSRNGHFLSNSLPSRKVSLTKTPKLLHASASRVVKYGTSCHLGQSVE